MGLFNKKPRITSSLSGLVLRSIFDNGPSTADKVDMLFTDVETDGKRKEVFTRTRFDRREWPKLMKKVKAGDEIVFDSVSRMSGNAEEGFSVYEELYNRGVSLVFLKEPHINTETYKKALENNVPLTGSSVDLILEGVN